MPIAQAEWSGRGEKVPAIDEMHLSLAMLTSRGHCSCRECRTPKRLHGAQNLLPTQAALSAHPPRAANQRPLPLQSSPIHVSLVSYKSVEYSNSFSPSNYQDGPSGRTQRRPATWGGFPDGEWPLCSPECISRPAFWLQEGTGGAPDYSLGRQSLHSCSPVNSCYDILFSGVTPSAHLGSLGTYWNLVKYWWNITLRKFPTKFMGNISVWVVFLDDVLAKCLGAEVACAPSEPSS